MKKSIFRPALVGAMSGFLVFLALNAMTAQQGFSVAQIASDPARYWGKGLTVIGIAGPISTRNKTVNWDTGEQVQYTSISLYEPGQGNSKTGKHYIYVDIPSAQFRYRPNEGDTISVPGTLAAPANLGELSQ